MISLLAAIIIAQTQIPSTTIPPTAERSVVFQDRGRVYIVGVDSGKVTFLDNAPAPNPNPLPDDDTEPPVPPTPIALDYKYVTVAIDKGDTARAAWKSSEVVRDAITAKGARVSFYTSDEADIDRRNIRPYIEKNGGLPVVILQDGAGKVLLSKKVETEAQLLEVLK
jgi:hypothetical protein